MKIMKMLSRTLAAMALVASLVAGPLLKKAWADTIGLNIQGPDWHDYIGTLDGTSGYEFTITQPMTVSGLGFWSPTSSHPFTVSVGLWQFNNDSLQGPLIGSVSMASATLQIVATGNGYGQWNFMSFNAPLQPGVYVVGASGYDLPYSYNWDPANDNLPVSNYIQVAPGMTYVQGLVDTIDTGLSMPDLDCLGSVHGDGGATCPVSFFGANIEFAAVTATPLPDTLPLFATALGGLGLLGWCRNRKAHAVAA